MTHGDQAKAKTAKSSQASATKKSSSKTSGKAGQGSKSAVKTAKSGKTGSKEASQGGKAVKASSQKAVSQKSSPAPPKAIPAKEAGNGGKAGAKPRTAASPPVDTSPGFTNSAVASAFKRAVKKYPNAFRKLTD